MTEQNYTNNAALPDIDFSSINLQNPDTFLLKTLVFDNGSRHYAIRFNRTKIIQLRGDSSTGKTLFCSDLREQRTKIPDFPTILVIGSFNRESLGLLNDLNNLSYDLVVIDNADILLTPELDKAIFESLISANKTYWIIIGRKWFDCCSYSGCRGVLRSRKIRGNAYTFEIEYTDNLSD